MAVAFDAVGPSSSGSSTASYSTAISWTHTPVGTPTVAIVDVAVGADGATCSVTYGGTAMTSLGKVHSGGLTAGFQQSFALASPGSGAKTVTVTLTSGAGSTVAAASRTYTGTGTISATAWGTPVTASSSSSSASGSVNVTGASTSNMVVAGVCTGSGTEAASGGDTRRSVTDVSSSSAAGCGATFDKASAAGTVTINWTMSTDAWGVVAVELLSGAASNISSSDSGSGSESQSATSPFKSDSDAGSGAELWATNARKISSDSGSGADSQIGFQPYITGVAGGAAGYFQDQFGNPRLVWGDAAWALCGNVGRWSSGAWQSDYDTYLTTRQGQGITVIYGKPMGTTQSLDIDDQGGTFDGLYPFQGSTPSTGQSGASPTTGLTEAYWARIDYFVKSAQAKGITWFCNAIGYNSDFFSGPGPLAGKSQAEFQDYGAALAARYANQPNIVWVVADDYFGGDDAVITSFLTGLRNAGDNHAITIENYPETTSRTAYSRTDASCGTTNASATVTDSSCTANDVGAGVAGAGVPAGSVILSVTPGTSFVMSNKATATATVSLAIQNFRLPWGFTHAQYNFVYSYEVIYFGVELAYTADGTVPVIAGDGYFYQGGSTYQGGTSFAYDRYFRQESWWALSSGARGKIHGDEAIWQWQATAQASAASNWFWANNAKAIRTVVEGLAGWQNLIPDTSSALVTAGRNAHATYTTAQYEGAVTDSYVTASKTPDGKLALIYMSHGSTITIDQTKMAGPFYARQIDPVNGAVILRGAASSYNSTSWGNNSQGDPDWTLALVIDPNDGGTGSESAFVQVSSADAGSGADAATFTPPLTKSSSDAGTGAEDSGQVAAAVPGVDQATGADALKALTASLSDADQAAGVDDGQVLVNSATPQSSDSASGSELTGPVLASLSALDSGQAASESGKATSASLTDSETGTGLDALKALTASLRDSDTAAGADAGVFSPVGTIQKADSDSGHAQENDRHSVADSDSGTGAEGTVLLPGIVVHDDEATGADAESVFIAHGIPADADSGSGLELWATSGPKRDTESLSLIESGPYVLLEGISADSASGSDAQSPIEVFPFPLPWEFGPGGGLRLRPGGRVALIWHEGEPDELVVREWEQFHPSQAEYARKVIGSLAVSMVSGADSALGSESSLPTATIHQYATAPVISCSVPTA